MGAKAFFLVLFISITTFANEGFFAVKDGLPESLKDVEKATVGIYRGQALGAQFKISDRGTAFLVAVGQKDSHLMGYFLTASHVAPLDLSQSEFQIAYHYQVRENNILGRVDDSSWARMSKLIAIDRRADLALFEMTLPRGFLGTPVRFRDIDYTETGREVFAIGNPDFLRRKNWGVEKPKIWGLTYWSHGKFLGTGATELREKSGQVVLGLFHDADILPGNSGGPLIDEKGFVIGMNRALLATSKRGIREYSAIGRNGQAVSAKRIGVFLRENGI